MFNSSPFSPTARLILRAIKDSNAPLTFVELAEATGSSYWTVRSVAQDLVRQGHLHRELIANRSRLSLPVAASTQAVQQ
jgi:DNA-binding IclR family transcriptional regulator